MRLGKINISAMLLLLLFTSMQLLQAFHAHSDERQNLASVQQSKSTSRYQIVKHVAKCHVCEFSHHRMQDFTPASQQFDFTIVDKNFRSIKTGYAQRIFESSVHTWTNKGPPATLQA